MSQHLEGYGADAYRVRHRRGDVDYSVERSVRGNQPWRYEGVLHEYLTREGCPRIENITGDVSILSRSVGARSRLPDKYLRDAEILRAALEREPGHIRYLFYLAQSLRDAGDLSGALDAYRRRSREGGWDEEIFIALRLCRQQGWWALGLELARQSVKVPSQNDLLFVEREVYRWRVFDEWAVAATWRGCWTEALHLNLYLLQLPGLPPGDRTRIVANQELCRSRVRAEACRAP